MTTYKTVQGRLDRLSMPEPNSGCQLWLGSTDILGYGQFKIGGKTIRAHRVAWAEKNGPIPDGLIICHKCDVPGCINVAHLFLGTKRDNAYDMIAKGRKALLRGEQSSRAIVNEEIVLFIRITPRINASLREELGLSRSGICSIRRRRSWKHVADEAVEAAQTKELPTK